MAKHRKGQPGNRGTYLKKLDEAFARLAEVPSSAPEPEPEPEPVVKKVPTPNLVGVQKPRSELFRRLGVIGTDLEPRFEMLYEALAAILPKGTVLRPIARLGLVVLNEYTVVRAAGFRGIEHSKVLAQARAAIGSSADATMRTTVVDAGGLEERLSSSIGYKDFGLRLKGNQFRDEGKKVDEHVRATFPHLNNLNYYRDYMLRLADALPGIRFRAETYEPAREAANMVFPAGTPLFFDAIPPLPPIEMEKY